MLLVMFNAENNTFKTYIYYRINDYKKDAEFSRFDKLVLFNTEL
ncbi:hypothetical protein HNP25_003153 [Arcicella rosea]|uniref:Uncharacterized protein n=1 Tax=Arcicella rosea TaxID=502909 RepID=A0A841EW02_9BACT|nr:hypothetical protein [Arcicella rosea]